MTSVTYRIGKRFAFAAAHHLHGLEPGHKCARMHGHSYEVEVQLEATELVGPGFVTDFGDLEPLKKHLQETYDHQLLNDRMASEPTAENLAREVAEWFIEHLESSLHGRLVTVRVWESTSSWAEVHVT